VKNPIKKKMGSQKKKIVEKFQIEEENLSKMQYSRWRKGNVAAVKGKRKAKRR